MFDFQEFWSYTGLFIRKLLVYLWFILRNIFDFALPVIIIAVLAVAIYFFIFYGGDWVVTKWPFLDIDHLQNLFTGLLVLWVSLTIAATVTHYYAEPTSQARIAVTLNKKERVKVLSDMDHDRQLVREKRQNEEKKRTDWERFVRDYGLFLGFLLFAVIIFLLCIA